MNGEAIFGTRPWTTRGETLYAVCLDWPPERFIIESLATGKIDREIAGVHRTHGNGAEGEAVQTRLLLPDYLRLTHSRRSGIQPETRKPKGVSMVNDLDFLERLSNVSGVCGHEDTAQDLVEAELAGCCDEVWRDAMGNLFGLKKATARPAVGDPPSVMFAGHVDEIGLIVTHVDDEGFIRFAPVGGLSSQYLISQRVIVHGTEPVSGVIPPKYQGLMSDEEKKKVLPLEDLYIDTGLPGEEVRAKVTIGDIVSIDSDFRLLNPKVVLGRNFDDRLGVYSMVQAMKALGETHADVYAVSTVQEEVGVRGAHTAAYAVDPDYGVAIDGSITWDVPHAPAHQKHCSLGEGTGIYIMDRLTIGSPKLVSFLIHLCERNGIAYQRNVGGGTDASAMQRAKGGALSTTIGAPTRYMHSSVQLAHVDDLLATSALLKTFAEHAHELADYKR